MFLNIFRKPFDKKLLRGALTNKSVSFKSRPWELRSVCSIDVFDSLNNCIEVNIRGNDIIRILPTTGMLTAAEGTWISDRIRYSTDAFRLQRLDSPLLCSGPKHRKSFQTLRWKEFFTVFTRFKILNCEVGFLNNNTELFKNLQTIFFQFFNEGGVPLDLSSYFWLDKFYDFFSMNYFVGFNQATINSSLVQPLPIIRLITKSNASSLGEFNFKNYSTLFLVGSELTSLSPTVWALLHQLTTRKLLTVYTFGDGCLTKFSRVQKNFKHVGPLSEFKKVIEGRHWLSIKSHSATLKANKINHLVSFVVRTVEDLIFLNYINQHVTTTSEISFNVFPLYITNTVIHNSLFGLSTKTITKTKNFSNCFILTKEPAPTSLKKKTKMIKQQVLNELLSVYFSSHANFTLTQTNLAIPAATFFEKTSMFHNLLGQLKHTKQIINMPGLSVEPFNFLILIYSLLIKSCKNPTVFLSYLFNYTLKNLVLLKKNQVKFSFINALILQSINKKLTVSSFLKLATDTLHPLFVPRMLFNLSNKACVDNRIVETNLWINAKLKTTGYLQLNDEITAHSKTLAEVHAVLTKN